MMHLDLRGGAARHLSTLALALALALPSLGRAQDVPEAQPEVAPEGTPPTQPPPITPPPPPPVIAAPVTEQRCDDRQDDDGDGLVDCADADCFDADICHAGGREERTDAACSDFIDNDGDQMVDCEDSDCQVGGITVCSGSWRGAGGGGGGGAAALGAGGEDLPELGEGQSVEDLIGTGGDANGERTDETCSDGIDNDFDGRSDCADFGCRFDPQVTVCNGTPGLRFSVVAGVGASIQFDYDQSPTTGERITNAPEAGFTLLQLRALGPIPFIENSFFLINVRAEDRVRLTFANFQIPISSQGHYLSLNSGFGGLSPGLIISAARQPLLEPAFYLYSAFEQGNGAALETGGPIDDRGTLRFRIFGAAGAGEFTGNVGGRFFRSDDRNFAWAAGAALQINILGYYDRFDSPFLYTPAPLTWGVSVGGKFDQRPAERFAATNVFSLFQVWHFSLRVESYTRFLLDDPMTIPVQTSFNVQLGVLLIPRILFFAADFGGVYQLENWSAGAFPPMDPAFREQLDQLQWRAALHWYFFRSTGILAILYREAYLEENPDRFDDPEVERELRIEARFRF